MTNPLILELKDIRKYFGAVKAVDGVSFSIRGGEIHAIVGENGAGKSTLMNVLAGVYPADAGQILLDGNTFSPSNPREARSEGISIVFQELALFGALSVEANLFAGKEVTTGLQLDHQAMKVQASNTLDQMAVNLETDDQVGNLTVGQQQWVEIARAIIEQSKVLILDEPNSALNQYETQELFSLIRHLKSQGITVIYISHRLEEVFQIADRITVMRDGHYIGTWETSQTNISEIVAAMVGREVDELFQRDRFARDRTILEVQDLSVDSRLRSISFQVKAGEVVGVAGLAGAGITPLFEALFGVENSTRGKMLLEGSDVEIKSPVDAIENQIAMVPADRRGLGLMLNWSVAKNSSLAVLKRFSRLGILNHRRLREISQRFVERLRIVTESLDKIAIFLSGGNQQKVLLSRWLATEPHLLILDDPTRGIDVGAKHEIYELIDNTAKDGVGILLTSSELDEILALSDRVLILRNGTLIADLPREVFEKDLVMEFVAGDISVGIERLSEKKSKLSGESPQEIRVQDPRNSIVAASSDDVDREPRAAVDDRSEMQDTQSGESLGARIINTLRSLWSIREVGVLQALIFTVILFSLITPYFFTLSNISLILRQMSILAIVTVGMTYVLASGEVDLSVGYIFNTVMSVMAFLAVSLSLDPWYFIPIGLLVGVVLGAVNGIIAVSLNLSTIIITLGTMTVYRGFGLALNQGRTISGLPESTFFQIGSGTLGPFSFMTIVMLVIFFATAWIWRNTKFARQILLMGGNLPAAERVGVKINNLRIMVMAFSGLMCGVAGVIGLAFLGAADAQSGKGYELSAIAAAIVGGAQLGGGAGTIWGSLIGITLIMAIQNGLVLLGLRPAWQIAFTGLVILAAVTIDYLTRTRRARARRQLNNSDSIKT